MPKPMKIGIERCLEGAYNSCKEVIYMYQKKKIALFISHIYGDYQKMLCQGVIAQAEEYGYRTEIYATNDGEDLGEYAIGEESILNIPNFSDLDGIIFASSTYNQQSMKEKLRRMLKKQKNVQVIEVCENPTDFPSVCMENNLTAGTLTEHLITVHAAKKICYLGLGKDNYFSSQRLKAYETVMARHMLTVNDSDVFIKEADNTYEDAIMHFTEGGTRKIDGVICYNDEVALNFWASCYDKGYEVPRDFAITGCDESEAGQNIAPALTTVTFPAYQVGVSAVELLMKHAKGSAEKTATVFAEPVYGGSCGCNCQRNEPSFKYDKSLIHRIESLEHSMFTSMKMSANFAHVTDVDDGMDLLESYVEKMDGCKEFYLCLYSDWDNIKSEALSLATEEYSSEYDDESSRTDSDTMLLKLAIRSGKRLPECSFSKTSLLPEFLQKDSTSSYLVCPLFFESRDFGYVAMSFENNEINFEFRMVHWIMNITQMLQSLCETKHTQALAKHLEDIYLKDVVTGLYNHHGFIRQQEKMLASTRGAISLCAVMIDLDLLKTINDHFGHQEGDFALRVIGQAISSSLEEGSFASRFTGDEFYILLVNADQEKGEAFVKKVHSYLENFNRLSSKPFNISLSSGINAFTLNEATDSSAIDAAFDLADENMYEEKNAKTKNVLR